MLPLGKCPESYAPKTVLVPSNSSPTMTRSDGDVLADRLRLLAEWSSAVGLFPRTMVALDHSLLFPGVLPSLLINSLFVLCLDGPRSMPSQESLMRSGSPFGSATMALLSIQSSTSSVTVRLKATKADRPAAKWAR